tara:strand:+ start:177 stop:536 length:360 start_codon:yes stop_codon:yes gene_type:complete
MKQKLAEVYNLIEGAVDDAFLRQNLNLKLYEYLKQNNFTKDDLGEILHSPSVISISSISSDLADYIEGGSDDAHKQLREAYGYLSKPLARKVKIYLDGMVDDVIRYRNDKGKRIKKRSK